MNFYEFFQLVGGNIWLYGGAFFLVLSILVFVHEWGHYIVARMCGVRVESFSIGFGKELFGYTDKNQTRWKFSLIPLGGYVKMFGDTDPASAGHEDGEQTENGDVRPYSDAERKQAFYAQPVWKRSAIVFAGPLINYLFAIVILAGMYMYQGQPVTQPYAAAVIGGSSAEQAGFLPQDRIISIDGKSIASFEDIRREMLVALDQERRFIVARNGEEIEIVAAPQKLESEDRFGFKQSRGMLGLISPRYMLSLETIQTIDGQEYESLEDKRDFLSANMEQIMVLGLDRGDDVEFLTIKPLADLNASLSDPDSSDFNFLYIGNDKSDVFIRHNPLKAIAEATNEAYEITRSTIEALGQMIVGVRSATELGGVIRIGAVAGDMAQQGVIALILFTALLSINLGFINLLPIPLLDGGHLVFYAFEALLGRPIPEQVQEYAFRFGLVLLVGIMVFANLNDIMQLIL